MSLLTLRNLTLSFGTGKLLDKCGLSLEAGQRIAIVGRNGEGKSTLLGIIQGTIEADEGDVIRRQGLKIATLPQEVPTDLTGSTLSVIVSGFGEAAMHLQRYESLLHQNDNDPSHWNKLSALQEELELSGGWQLRQQALQWVSRLGLSADDEFSSLSGGRKRRVLLARALITQPDILLLDEPTNHLDISSISWLEEQIRDYRGTVVFISHDRAFLQAVATRIVELDRGQLYDFPGNYSTFIERREQRLSAEASADAEFDRKLAQEEVWIRKGIEARRTRNEGRVRALIVMRSERADRRERKGNVAMEISSAERSGKLVMTAEHLSCRFGDQPLIDDFSTTILRGDRIGLIGDNGVGKSTLIKLLLGEITPQSGLVRHGTRLEVAYFDQLRSQLDEEATVFDNIVQGSDFIEVNGSRKHALAYLQDFLFAPARSRTPVRALSGGERNRLLLAKLFARPTNLLVMDEPTNDLDLETLELLEELLLGYQGTLLLISHDRAFLNNVVTSTWAFEGPGQIREYVGGYDDWLRQRPAHNPSPVIAESACAPAPQQSDTPSVTSPQRRKLSFNEQRELKGIPDRIATLEQEQASIHQRMDDPRFFVDNTTEAAAAGQRLAAIEEELLDLLERWEALGG